MPHWPFDPRLIGLGENDARQVVLAAAIFIWVYFGIVLLRRHVIGRLQKAIERSPDAHVKELLENLLAQVSGPEAPVVAFFLATRNLAWPAFVQKLILIAVVLAVGYRLIRAAQDVAGFLIRRMVLAAQPSRSEAAAQSVTVVSNVAIWVLGILLILANLGVNVSALLTGLGIGGVAVALAAQSIFADFFAAIVIFMDRPFTVGDRVALDNDWKGRVERIGFKTTRLRADAGELLVVPNSVLTTNKLRNLGQPR